MAPVPGAGRQLTARRLRPDWAEFACCRSERRLRAERAARLPMSAFGQKRTLNCVHAMSALPPKADIAVSDWHVRFVPKADIGIGSNPDIILGCALAALVSRIQHA